jgi:hypothetical protein
MTDHKIATCEERLVARDEGGMGLAWIRRHDEYA